MSDNTVRNQFEMRNPLTQYPQPPFAHQVQQRPGLAAKMQPKPDHGENSYQGFGRLAGRKALITGADSGIGRATAIAYAREGADIVFTHLPEEAEEAKQVVALIEKAGRKALALSADLSKEDVCENVVRHAVEHLGGLDIVVNNAGRQTAQAEIADLTTEQFESTFRTNVFATFWISKAALPHLPEGATIINTASIQAYQPSQNLLDYAPTKAAIVAFTKALSKQVISKGIRVNAVAPGPFWTALEPSGGQPPEAIPTFGEQVPFKRPGQPAEIAPMYVLLASQESSYITGEVMGVTGGQTLP
ncbi:SDR family oxidoreductase [Robbsia sp. KACC 23696]|uniref:SDR family oxidoreductase n=1 Tax=Robbsia sp. KACC 23696 TaxID=3149231 RepID=UPI00325BFDCD